MSTAPIPSVGRIVLVPHERLRGTEVVSEVVPAIVTHVHSDVCVSVVVLSAFTESPAFAKTSLLYNQDDKRPGTWHWMPYQLQAAVAPKA